LNPFERAGIVEPLRLKEIKKHKGILLSDPLSLRVFVVQEKMPQASSSNSVQTTPFNSVVKHTFDLPGTILAL
jgi:hypothetical protein